jgi:outer membrane lipopolysaccharide assembly protein LptE/RlpB
MKKVSLLILSSLLVALAGCGYSTRSISPRIADIKTIYVEPFKNGVDYSTERGDKNLYVPMMEVKITNETINRFLRDGIFKIAKQDAADVILKSELKDYRRDVLRYDDNENVQEYRITIIISMTLWNTRTNETMWSEPNFAGDTTYFVSGSNAKSESTAIDDAIKELA